MQRIWSVAPPPPERERERERERDGVMCLGVWLSCWTRGAAGGPSPAGGREEKGRGLNGRGGGVCVVGDVK